MKNQPTEWKILRTVRESSDVTSVYIEGPSDIIARKKAGQFASIRVMRPDGRWSDPHPFTISCAPDAGYIQMTIKEAGPFTQDIKRWKPGMPLKCSGPLGAFCSDIHENKRIVMIAGGVGITPFLSVLRDFRSQGARNEVILFWCNKTLDDAFAREELSETARQINLRVVHVLSRTEELPCSLEDRTCYVKGRLSKSVIQQYLDNQPASFYLCGPTAMQNATLEILRHCGVDPKAVQREIFAFGKRN